MSSTQAFLLALVVIFSVPYLAWRLLRLEQIAPLAIVQIIGGVLLGPAILGNIAPSFYQSIFTASSVSAITGIANWAVMIFVFFAGCELELNEAWAHRRDVATTAVLALVTPLAFGLCAALLLLHMGDQWGGGGGHVGRWHWAPGWLARLRHCPSLFC